MGIPAQWERPSPASRMGSPSIGLRPTITEVGLEKRGQHDYARLKPIQRHDQSIHTSMFSDADSLTFHGAQSLTNVSGDYIVQVSESSRPAIPTREEQRTSESVSERYARIHFPMRNGYAIWYPQPMTSAPQEYREHGVRIGDVVLVSPNGQTDFLFNIMVGKDDPINQRGVPDGFVPISPPAGGWEVNTNEDYFTPGKNMLSGSVETTDQQGGIDSSDPVRYTFRCRPREGAILALPGGATQEDLINHGSFYTYAAKHAMDWYQYVNQRRDRAASNGSLYLVTGHDKTHVWGTASFSSVLTPDGFPISYGSTDPNQERRKYSHVWTQSGSASTQTGPALQNCDNQGNRRRNQCVFIRGYKITLAETIWQKLFVGQVTVEHTRESSYNDTLVPFRDSESPGWKSYLGLNTWTRHGGASNGSERRSSGQVQSAVPSVSLLVPKLSRSLHPSNIINQWLLYKDPEATCAITHDSVWCSAIEGLDSVPDASTLIELVEKNHNIKARNGSLTVERKIRQNDHEKISASEPQQALYTTTDVKHISTTLDSDGVNELSEEILDSSNLITSSPHVEDSVRTCGNGVEIKKSTFTSSRSAFSRILSCPPTPVMSSPIKQTWRFSYDSFHPLNDGRDSIIPSPSSSATFHQADRSAWSPYSSPAIPSSSVYYHPTALWPLDDSPVAPFPSATPPQAPVRPLDDIKQPSWCNNRPIITFSFIPHISRRGHHGSLRLTSDETDLGSPPGLSRISKSFSQRLNEIHAFQQQRYSSGPQAELFKIPVSSRQVNLRHGPPTWTQAPSDLLENGGRRNHLGFCSPLQVNNRMGLSTLEQCSQSSWDNLVWNSFQGQRRCRERLSSLKTCACRESDQREATRASNLEATLWQHASNEDARCEACKTDNNHANSQYAIVAQWTSQENGMNHFEPNRSIKIFDITRKSLFRHTNIANP